MKNAWTRRMALAAGAAALAPVQARAQERPAEEQAYAALLTAYVSASGDGVNRVAYRRWRADGDAMRRLDSVVAGLARRTPSHMERDEAIAFWANLYNALTLQVILSHYPVRSIRNIRSEGAGLNPQAFLGPWQTRLVRVEGDHLSLDDIEHRILRPLAQDPRVHYAVNCASIGCPNLQTTPWRAATLQSDLDRAARSYVNHPRAARITANGQLRVSSIYEWFKDDFGGADAGVIAHLRRFAAENLQQRLATVTRIAGHSYDWALNDAA